MINEQISAMERLKSETENGEKVVVFSRHQLLTIHRELVEAYNIPWHGTYDRKALEEIAKEPYREKAGKCVYPTPFDRAAKYMTDIIKKKPFHTVLSVQSDLCMALETGSLYLAASGYELTLSEEKKYFMIKDIENGKLGSVKDLSGYLRDHAKFAERKNMEYTYTDRRTADAYIDAGLEDEKGYDCAKEIEPILV